MGDSAVKPKIGKPGIIGIVAGAVVIVAAAVAAIILLSGKNDLVATTIRFLRMQGTVSLLDSKDRDVSITENLRLNNGNKVLTATESFASLGLDDYKIVALDQSSKTVVIQEGMRVELNLESGALYFNVTKALAEDESFDIKTSTMIVGIRGTCGYVSADDLFLVEGHVEVNDPTTGETFEVKAGEWLSRDPSTGKYTKKKYTLYDLPLLVISELARDDERRAQCLEVCGATEEEFWKYAMTLSPAYFDWADLEWPTFEEEVEEPEEEPAEEEIVEELEEEEEVAGETEEEEEAEEEEEEEPEEVKYTITVYGYDGGTVTASASSAKEGEVITLTAVADGGKELARWEPDENVTLQYPNGIEKPTFVMPATNVKISAAFGWATSQNKPTYSISVASTDTTKGTVSVSPASAKEGDTVTLTATPINTFYRLKAWNVLRGGVTVNNNTFTMPAGDVEISAEFGVDPGKIGWTYATVDNNGTMEPLMYLGEDGTYGQEVGGNSIRLRGRGNGSTFVIPGERWDENGNSRGANNYYYFYFEGLLKAGDVVEYKAFGDATTNNPGTAYVYPYDLDSGGAVTFVLEENTIKGIASFFHFQGVFFDANTGDAVHHSFPMTVKTKDGNYVFTYDNSTYVWTYACSNNVNYTFESVSNANGYEMNFKEQGNPQAPVLSLRETDQPGTVVPHL